MLSQLLVGGAASICNITIHALVMTAVIKVARTEKGRLYVGPLPLIRIMIATVSVLMAAHTLEVCVWSMTYQIVGAAPADRDLLYFAFVNYTTLGYGDITPLRIWNLLGPITAMNGILLFGWSTAVIFEVLRRALIRIDEIAHSNNPTSAR
jgi:hypothetical protein